MKNFRFNAYALQWRAFVIVAVITLLPRAISIHGQDTHSERVGTPDDWTHHHAVFPDAGTAEQALQNGTFDRWVRTVNNPRY